MLLGSIEYNTLYKMNIPLTPRESFELLSELLEYDERDEDELVSNRPPISLALCDEGSGPRVKDFLGSSTERLSSFSVCITDSVFMVGRGGRGGGVFPDFVAEIYKEPKQSILY